MATTGGRRFLDSRYGSLGLGRGAPRDIYGGIVGIEDVAQLKPYAGIPTCDNKDLDCQ